MNHGWQSEPTDGLKGAWSLSLSFSLFLSNSLSFSDYLPTYLLIYLFIYLSIYLSFFLSIYLSVYLSFFLSIYRSIYLSIYLSISLSISLSLCLSVCLSVYLSIYLSARSKTKKFCETSLMFEHNKVRNEAILRDVLIFRFGRHQKRSNSARLPSKMENWVQSWQPRTNAFCNFSSPPVESTAPATENWWQVIRSAAPVTQNHLSKPVHLILQNATLLRKSAPWPLNISLRLPRKVHLCRSSSNVPCLPSFLEMLQNRHVLLTFEQVHNPLRLPRETTSERQKVVWCF